MAKNEKLLEQLDDWAYDHVPIWLYRLPTQVKSVYYGIKYFLQKVFRKNHLSDVNVWNAGYEMVKVIYPRLKAFIKLDQSGYPSIFSEYDDQSGWKSKEDYDKAKALGYMVGGGAKKWEETLNEMLFACEHTIYGDDDNKKSKAFYKKWNLEDPHAKIDSNKSESFFSDEPFYYNVELAIEYSERAQKGFELLGKYILNIWD